MHADPLEVERRTSPRNEPRPRLCWPFTLPILAVLLLTVWLPAPTRAEDWSRAPLPLQLAEACRRMLTDEDPTCQAETIARALAASSATHAAASVLNPGATTRPGSAAQTISAFCEGLDTPHPTPTKLICYHFLLTQGGRPHFAQAWYACRGQYRASPSWQTACLRDQLRYLRRQPLPRARPQP